MAALLDEYATKVPPAAALVKEAVAAEIRVETAKKNLQLAKTEEQTTGAQANTFILAQQLEKVVAQANDAKKQAAAAAASISTGSKLPYILGGAIAIGIGVWLLKRKK